MSTVQILEGGTQRYMEVAGNKDDTVDGARFVHEIRSMGQSPFIGIFGELAVEERTTYVSVNWSRKQYNTAFDMRPFVSTGDGALDVSNGYLTVSSASSGTAQAQSLDVVRYVNGSTLFMFFTASFSGAGKGYAGGLDSNDAFQIGYDNGILKFGYVDGGVRKGSNGATGFDTVDTSSVPGFDVTKINIYAILGGYLGVASPILMVRKNGRWYTLHTVNTEGVLNDTHVDIPAFPMGVYAENGCSVSTGSWKGGLLGRDDAVQDRSFAYPSTAIVAGTGAEYGQITLAGTAVSTAAIFHSKTTFNGVANKTRSKLFSYRLSVDPPTTGNGVVIVQLVKNGTYSGAPTYTDYDTTNSVIEIDAASGGAGNGASVTYSSGGNVFPLANLYYSAGNQNSFTDTATIDAERIGALLRPDETMGLIAKDRGGNNVVLRFTFNWIEET